MSAIMRAAVYMAASHLYGARSYTVRLLSFTKFLSYFSITEFSRYFSRTEFLGSISVTELLAELEIVVELGNLVPRKNLVSQKVFLILRYLQS